jgi:hypothetical protein
MFSFCYVSAFHAPRPRDAPLVLVGPEPTTAAIAARISSANARGLSVSATSSAAAAKNLVLNRGVIGAIVLGDPVTAYVASGDGAIASTTVTSLARSLGAGTHAPVTVVDLAPLAPADTSGAALFYFLVSCTIAGYLTITVLSQAVPDLSLRTRYAVLGGTSICAPAITLAISSLFIGTLNASTGALAAMLGVAAVYTFTVGSLTIVAHQTLGRAAIFPIMTLVVFLNFPSAGGAVPAGFLPTFWRDVHTFWVGSAAMEPMRAVVYFHGRGAWHWLDHLAIWLLVALALSALLALRGRGQAVVPGETRPTRDRSLRQFRARRG